MLAGNCEIEIDGGRGRFKGEGGMIRPKVHESRRLTGRFEAEILSESESTSTSERVEK